MTSGWSDGDGFVAFAELWRPRVETCLQGMVPPPDAPPEDLHRAMRHAMFPGGKRLRPLLALLGCRATGGDMAKALVPAAGLECLHTYSLVHDDLPCMDDDDMRRGRPTCHVAFGEALAVLAGDALLTLAFHAAATGGSDAVAELATAAGSLGMVGGQAADLEAEADARKGAGPRSLQRVQWIHDRKTGALIEASLVVGALAGRGGEALAPRQEELLRQYGRCVGRAFQIADDCLDLTGDVEDLGKNPGSDTAHGKLTYPAVLGLEESRAEARRLAEEAARLGPELVRSGTADPGTGAELDEASRLLQDVAFYSVTRNR